MSYTRHYRETVSTTVSISYPKSENGGTVSKTVNIPVDVNIHVDTQPFDASVHQVNTSVDLLTGAVVATEAAEIISREKNSKKVANTILDGFFSYIRSEISQQVAELSQSIDAHFMHLQELMHSCLKKKAQMEGDYQRISSRYTKVFEDLNQELSNRIYELDKPAFMFKRETDSHKIRSVENDLVSTIAIFGFESSELQTRISASVAKKRAVDTLMQARLYLMQQKRLNYTIQHSMLNEEYSSTVYIPVCYMETRNDKEQIDQKIYYSSGIPVFNQDKMKNDMVSRFASKTVTWTKVDNDTSGNLGLYFTSVLNAGIQSNDMHSSRVIEMIRRIADIDKIYVIKISNQ